MSKTILIVDDEPTLANNLARMLRRAGFASRVAGDGQGAADALRLESVEFMCLDIRLPDCDGLELLERLRPHYPDLPVVVMTAHHQETDLGRARNLGVVATFSKPFALAELRDLIVAHAGARQLRQDSGAPIMAEGPRRGRPLAVMMYSHDGVGLGHMRRNANIAAHLVGRHPQASVLMLVGSPAGVFFDLPAGIDFVKLPSIVKVGTNEWQPGKLHISSERTRELRVRLIEEAIDCFRPDVFLVDHVPAGVWGELAPVFEHLRNKAQRPKLVLGLRDILDTPEVVRATWRRESIYQLIATAYDLVLIYGAPEMFNTVAAYGLQSVADRVRYCGYVCAEEAPISGCEVRRRLGFGPAPMILVAAGGGYDAFPMMSACLGTFRHLGAACPPAVVVTGPLMPRQQRLEIERMADGLPVHVLSSVPDGVSLIAAADLVITMGGYNTLMEALRFGKRILAIPRTGPSAEQKTRAALLERHGLIDVVDIETLTPASLAEAVLAALAKPPVAARSFAADGVGEAVRQLLGLVDHLPATHQGRAMAAMATA